MTSDRSGFRVSRSLMDSVVFDWLVDLDCCGDVLNGHLVAADTGVQRPVGFSRWWRVKFKFLLAFWLVVMRLFHILCIDWVFKSSWLRCSLG